MPDADETGGRESLSKAPTGRAGATTLRRVRRHDLPFLRRLYESTRAEEMALLPWSTEAKHDFLGLQFEAQHKFYLERFPEAQFDLVLEDGEPIGRLYVDRRQEEYRLVDITLLPSRRGNGIGGELIQRVLDEAGAEGRKVRLHVEFNNPAMKLYRRLGFETIEDQGVYHLMEWRLRAV